MSKKVYYESVVGQHTADAEAVRNRIASDQATFQANQISRLTKAKNKLAVVRAKAVPLGVDVTELDAEIVELDAAIGLLSA